MTVPCRWTLLSMNSNSFQIQFLTIPSLDVIISFIVVEKTYTAHNIHIYFDLFSKTNLFFLLTIVNDDYVDPRDETSFYGLMMLTYIGP